MLVNREKLKFNWGTACWNLQADKDRDLLAWILDQFLYGEVTGIQVGHWIYRAPSLAAASFLARQATEEFSHVKRLLSIYRTLDRKPKKAHPIVRFLSTGMMGADWGEHVALEMALGEGLVLGIFQALIDTLPSGEVRNLLESAAEDEQRHVEFGERETQAWLERHPWDRRRLRAQASRQKWAMARFRRFVLRKLTHGDVIDHPVMGRFAGFYDHLLARFDEQRTLLGLGDAGHAAGLDLLALPWDLLQAKLRLKSPRLTSVYLADPWVLARLDTEAEIR